jgi:excisionase family DNA binding protein
VNETTNRPPQRPSDLWNADDVARYLKVSRSWVYQRAESGELPCLHVGGLLRFEPDAVLAFARGETRASTVLPFSTSPSGKGS